MRVGFDCTPLCAPQSGVGTYTSNLFDALRAISADRLLPLAHRPRWSCSAPETAWPGRSLNKTVWMQALLPWQLQQMRADVCHFTNNVASLWTPCPAVVTIHDMTMWLFPEYHRRRRLLAMRPLIPLAARRAAAIITVSESSKRDIVRLLGVPASKVEVIYEAAAPIFGLQPPLERLEAVRLQYRLPNRFLLYVGTIEPRKNLVRLLEAFAQFRRETNWPDPLVLVGQRGWREEAVFAAAEKLELADAVRFLGYIPREALAALYYLAELVAFPSLYEGFGLPVVEAMSCGVPVVTSIRGSLGEVAGGAAEFVDPTSVQSINAGLQRVVGDPARRAELRSKGLERAAQFSWADAAEQTRGVYLRVVNGRAIDGP